MLTAIPDPIDPLHLARDVALTNRLRTEGTANLVAAAGAAARIIAQGIACAYDPAGSPVKDEDAPLWRRPPGQFPAWLAWLVAGGWAVAFMTSLAGASNLRARRQLDWKTTYSSWLQQLAGRSGRRAQCRHPMNGPPPDPPVEPPARYEILHGLLTKIRDLNLPLIAVRRVQP